ncbi:MAG TPA: serine hydrolase domain-containing protein [Actinophytocola sp.]|uniref:serine hydrolase domain-containing protein n=1 Tax=Actinophytocola sp. TaxID=1872138 RepID=UPI002DDD808A|nr:serine hydrolase domain-containing protein [Actinophytocola sp.]HEV2783216.1 serine hydrolase domain-containing protein [Actinophytocola sp.]
MYQRRRTGATVAAAVLGMVATTSFAPPAGADVQSRLSAVLANGASGAIVLVDNGTRDIRIAGERDVAAHQPMLPNARVRIASITKTFVAAVALQLIDEGRIGLDLDDTVQSLLPGLLPTFPRITVRQLLNHTSSLAEYMYHPRFVFTVPFEPGYQAEPGQLVDLANRLRCSLLDPCYLPGRDWNYSNTNYIVLGMILEAKTGRTIEDLVRQRIIQPLGLNDTLFPELDTTIEGDHARGYLSPEVSLALGGPYDHVDVTEYSPTLSWAAGAMISTVGDLQTFFSALQAGDVVRDRVLLQQMATADAVTFRDPHGYGLGLDRSEVECGGQSREFWGHNGYTPGYVTYALHDPATRRGAVVAVPTTPDIPLLLPNTSLSDAIDALVAEAACASLDLPYTGG